MRDRLIAGVRAAVPSAVLRGDPIDRVDNNVHFTFPGCQGDSLLFLLDAAGVSVSTGSACQAGIPEASHVLLGMGLSESEALGALRITVGHTTTEADVDAFLAALPAAHEVRPAPVSPTARSLASSTGRRIATRAIASFSDRCPSAPYLRKLRTLARTCRRTAVGEPFGVHCPEFPKERLVAAVLATCFTCNIFIQVQE